LKATEGAKPEPPCHHLLPIHSLLVVPRGGHRKTYTTLVKMATWLGISWPMRSGLEGSPWLEEQRSIPGGALEA
jgi:hypothetical protein